MARKIAPRSPGLVIENRRNADLKLDPGNPRLHSERQVAQIAHSIRAFGFNVPILIDRNAQVVAGHGRLAACKLLGIKEVPTICLDHLSAEQAKAFLIADNRLTENGSWDAKLLGEQFQILSAANLDFSLEVTGFEIAEIDTYIEGLSEPPLGSDPADKLPASFDKPAVTHFGDLWWLGKHRVLCGTALRLDSVRQLMAKEKASAVFTDPPYNVPIDGHVSGHGKIRHKEFSQAAGEMSEAEFTDFLAQALRLAAEASLDGSLHFVCMDWRHLRELTTAGKEAYAELKNVCVWVKDNGGMGSLYRSQHEFVFVFKKGESPHRNNVQLGQFGRYRTNVWQYGGANSFARNTEEGDLLALHPTVKPVALVADAIMDCTARGETVLDPFLGSGSTIIAAERTGRVGYGIEIDPLYVDTIVRRWQEFTGKVAMHATSGRSFNELEKEVADGR